MTAKAEAGDIRVNRAPVLTLWAAVVAERLRHDPDAAITLGRALAGYSARSKAKAIGLEDEHHSDQQADVRERQSDRPPRTVHLLGREVPVVEQKRKLRALDHDKPASVRAARSYVERAFGQHLPAVRKAMEQLAASVDPDELNRVGFRLYEQFRPEVPAGARGWGAKGLLDLGRIRDAARGRR